MYELQAKKTTSRITDKKPGIQQHYKERGVVSYEKTKSTTSTNIYRTKNATTRAAIEGKSIADGIAIRIEEENGFTSDATSCADDTTNDSMTDLQSLQQAGQQLGQAVQQLNYMQGI